MILTIFVRVSRLHEQLLEGITAILAREFKKNHQKFKSAFMWCAMHRHFVLYVCTIENLKDSVLLCYGALMHQLKPHLVFDTLA